MKLRNIIASINSQRPFYQNFIKSGNGFGIFSKNSHSYGGVDKICFSSKASAEKSAAKMQVKTGNKFSAYKCMHCDAWHVGKDKR